MASTVAWYDEVIRQAWNPKHIGRQFVIPIRVKSWWEDVAADRVEREKSMGDLLDEVWT